MLEQLEEKIFARRIEAKHASSELPRQICERFAAAAGLFLLTPVLIFCALLIFLSSRGTILFRQQRIGRGGRIFTLYKFRTMKTSSKGLPFTAENDGRITRVGKFLRKTKLDELPQLFNVVRGEMSFVGPRPEVAELVDFNCPKWRKILSVRPGITDPVTLRLRSEGALLAGVEDKQAFYRDVLQPYKLNGYLQYLEEKSVKTDLKIIAQTIKAILFPRTAPTVSLEELKTER